MQWSQLSTSSANVALSRKEKEFFTFVTVLGHCASPLDILALLNIIRLSIYDRHIIYEVTSMSSMFIPFVRV